LTVLVLIVVAGGVVLPRWLGGQTLVERARTACFANKLAVLGQVLQGLAADDQGGRPPACATGSSPPVRGNCKKLQLPG